VNFTKNVKFGKKKLNGEIQLNAGVVDESWTTLDEIRRSRATGLARSKRCMC
jgi:hypothetical protein